MFKTKIVLLSKLVVDRFNAVVPHQMPFSEKFTKAFWVHAIPVDVLKRRKGLTFRRGHQCPRPSFFLKRTELLPVLLLPDIPSCGEIKDRVHVHLQAQTLSMWGHSGWGEQLGKSRRRLLPLVALFARKQRF